jgi:hypothetical protein
MSKHVLVFGLAVAAAACIATESLCAQNAARVPAQDSARVPTPASARAPAQAVAQGPVSDCSPGAFRTCNSVQIVVQPLSAVPFGTFSLIWRNRPGFGGPFVSDTTAGVVDLSPRIWDIVADPFILSGYAFGRARAYDWQHLLASMRGGRGKGGRGGRGGGGGGRGGGRR